MVWKASAISPISSVPVRPGRALAILSLALTVSGCVNIDGMDQLGRLLETMPRPSPVVAMDPIPNPVAASVPERTSQSSRVRAGEPQSNPLALPEGDAAARTRLLVRQNQWLTRFWMELRPDQQARVARRLRGGDVQLASEQAEPAATWDRTGLADRARLIFGNGPASRRPAPVEASGGSTSAGDP